MNRLLAVVCYFRGHVNAATMLPEEPFGLYAYSKLWCSRCGQVQGERSIEEQIDVLMGYVSLWNDVRPIVEAARAFMTDDYTWSRQDKGDPGPALVAALAKYDEMYPEHRSTPTRHNSR